MIRLPKYPAFLVMIALIILLFSLACSREMNRPLLEEQKRTESKEAVDRVEERSPQMKKMQDIGKGGKTGDLSVGKGEKESRIILITVSSLRYDYMGCYGNKEIKTPAMDSLAADGILFERCITPNPQDLPAHAALMTGVYPEKLGVFDNAIFKLPERFKTLAEILKDEGFMTAAFIGSSVLDRRFGLSQGFEDYFDQFDSLLTNTPSIFSERKAQDIVNDVINYLEKKFLGKDEKRHKLFLWIHLNDPSYDFNPPHPYEKSYKGEVEYIDNQLKRFFSFLDDHKLYDDSIIVLTADHGISLGQHHEKKHGIQLYESTIRVPLIIKPHKKCQWHKKHIDRTSGLIDIVSSLLHLAGLNKTDIKNDGHNLFENYEALYFSSSFHQFYAFGWKIQRAVYDGMWKFIQGSSKELYYLNNKEGEERNLLEENNDMAKKLMKRIEEFETHLKWINIENNRVVHDHLNSSNLAMIGFSWAPASSFNSGKKGIFEKLSEIEATFEEAQMAILNKQVRKSFRRMRKVLELDPENYDALMYTVSRHIFIGRKKKAEEGLSKFKQAYPERAEPYHLEGHLRNEEKEIEQALKSFLKALKVDPIHQESLYDTACMYSLLKKKRKALSFLEKAIQAGYNDFKHIETDPDLMNIRDSIDFKKILKKYQTK